MALVASAKTTGGRRLNDLLRNAGKGGVRGIRVGFQEGQQYNDANRTPVAQVAYWNNYGTDRIPARPFAQRGNARIEQGIGAQIAAGIDGKTMVIDRALADRLGEYAAGEWQQEITDLREPPNAPSTIQRKGSSNPLIASGEMRKAVTWQVE